MLKGECQNAGAHVFLNGRRAGVVYDYSFFRQALVLQKKMPAQEISNDLGGNSRKCKKDSGEKSKRAIKLYITQSVDGFDNAYCRHAGKGVCRS